MTYEAVDANGDGIYDPIAAEKVDIEGRLSSPAHFDAIVFKNKFGNAVYYDVTGRSGSTGTVTEANTLDVALQRAIDDYDGNVDGELSGVIYLAPAIYEPAAQVNLRRGVKIIGPRLYYSRSPSSASGREYLSKLEVTNMPSGSYFFNMDDSAVDTDAAGSGVYGIDMVGNGRNNNDVGGVRMGEAGRTVAQACVMTGLGRDGILAIDAFSVIAIENDIRDCGVYSEDGSGNENGTNGIRTSTVNQNVNLKVGATQVIQGPGAGTSNPSADIPSAIRTTSGASVQIEKVGGRRSGMKVHSGAATAAAVKGEDITMEQINITGEGTAVGVWMKGGTLRIEGGNIEKQRDLIYLENTFTNGRGKLAGVTFDSAVNTGSGDGNAIRVPSGGSGAPPTIDGCVFKTIDRSAIRLQDGPGHVSMTGGAVEQVDQTTNGSGWVVEDNRNPGTAQHSVIGTDVGDNPNGITNDNSSIASLVISEGRGHHPHTLLNREFQDLSTLGTKYDGGVYYHNGASAITADTDAGKGEYRWSADDSQFKLVTDL